MREDIYGGLKNAIERGVPLEIAIRSFVNAGYKEADVRAVARDIQTSVFPIAPTPVPRPAAMPTTPVAQRQPQIIPQQKIVSQPVPVKTYSMASQQPAQTTLAMSQPVQQVQQEALPIRAQSTPLQKPNYARRRPDFLIILLVIFLVVSILGFVGSIVFKDQIALFLKGIF